eukprot:CAMPEP_0197925638 /NCGR_PEP_ID=MMETSP1439-20131203/97798_1 /TAXON_ID=66791 /ORGANISM="Gonyaulax spinifera, Strain CCMP409" /LENGTH=172 /DNA_ID=CAMNT_0043548125 /DNA_START=116 /DNA_END=634 /DNA_ORIENTATION=+
MVPEVPEVHGGARRNGSLAIATLDSHLLRQLPREHHPGWPPKPQRLRDDGCRDLETGEVLVRQGPALALQLGEHGLGLRPAGLLQLWPPSKLQEGPLQGVGSGVVACDEEGDGLHHAVLDVLHAPQLLEQRPRRLCRCLQHPGGKVDPLGQRAQEQSRVGDGLQIEGGANLF